MRPSCGKGATNLKDHPSRVRQSLNMRCAIFRLWHNPKSALSDGHLRRVTN